MDDRTECMTKTVRSIFRADEWKKQFRFFDVNSTFPISSHITSVHECGSFFFSLLSFVLPNHNIIIIAWAYAMGNAENKNSTYYKSLITHKKCVNMGHCFCSSYASNVNLLDYKRFFLRFAFSLHESVCLSVGCMRSFVILQRKSIVANEIVSW